MVSIVRILKVMLIGIVVSGLVVPSLGCGSEPSEEAENQLVTVQRGDLIIDITAVGNLALSQTEDLAFEMAGTVEEAEVNEGPHFPVCKTNLLLARLRQHGL